MYVHGLACVVNVDQYLRCIADARHRRVQVLAASQGEVCYWPELEDVRAGDHEKIGQQFVGGPCPYQRREVVEDDAGIPATALDGVVHFSGKVVESRGGIDINHTHALYVREYGEM